MKVPFDDFIILVSLLGNDFIPGIPSLDIGDLDCIIAKYNGTEGGGRETPI